MNRQNDQTELYDDDGNLIEPATDDTQDNDNSNGEGAAAFTESVKEIAKSFTESLKEIRQSQAPVATPAGPDLDSVRDRVQKETNDMMEEYQRLAAAGEFAKAAQYLMTKQGEIQQSLRGLSRPEDDPGYKALYKGARKSAVRENKDLFDKYGDEIDAELSKFDATQRIDPDTWDEALNRVKARHIDEILQAKIDAAQADEQRDLAPEVRQRGGRVAPQARGRAAAGRQTVSTIDLNADQKDAARMLGLTEEEYAKMVAEEDQYTVRTRLGPMLSLAGEGKPKPGQF